jgi:primosomal protein N' (replication factor Y)
LKYLGIGTEAVEAEAKAVFPLAKVIRWDRDTTMAQGSHEAIMAAFRDRRADILVGTQMIAKGLDMPMVTLAGIVNSDTGLNIPDFRASERTFQLLCQVAGRAGRGRWPGRVIVQTYSPEHYAIRLAASHDYQAFYLKEIEYRRQFNYPPFSHLVRLVYSHTNPSTCRREAERLATLIKEKRDSEGITNLSLIGPSPAPVARYRGLFRWQLIIRGDTPAALLSNITLPQPWSVDVDPLGVV